MIVKKIYRTNRRNGYPINRVRKKAHLERGKRGKNRRLHGWGYEYDRQILRALVEYAEKCDRITSGSTAEFMSEMRNLVYENRPALDCEYLDIETMTDEQKIFFEIDK